MAVGAGSFCSQFIQHRPKGQSSVKTTPIYFEICNYERNALRLTLDLENILQLNKKKTVKMIIKKGGMYICFWIGSRLREIVIQDDKRRVSRGFAIKSVAYSKSDRTMPPWHLGCRRLLG